MKKSHSCDKKIAEMASIHRGRDVIPTRDLIKLLDRKRLPKHIAVIMDGNGRWAEKKALSRVRGHRAGVKAVRDTVKMCRELQIPYLTLYAFSKENWDRPEFEVKALMNLLKRYLALEEKGLMKNNIRLMAIGDLSDLPAPVYKTLKRVIKKTQRNNAMVLILALSYGGRTEIIQAMKKLFLSRWKSLDGRIDIDEQTFSRYLYTSGMPDPDLLIRTSGEYRLSNFMLWQMAYTELYITETLWPDFRKRDLLEAILDYQQRERRFGLTGDQIRESEETRHTRLNRFHRQ